MIRLWEGAARVRISAAGTEKHRWGTGSRAVHIAADRYRHTQLRSLSSRSGEHVRAAVIVCPGGGYSILAYDLEGTEIAEWLQGIGVTALVLKYRVPKLEGEEPGQRPLMDLQRAIRTVRSRAAELKINPAKIGVLGFSAGATPGVMAAERNTRDPPTRPQDDVDQQSTSPTS